QATADLKSIQSSSANWRSMSSGIRTGKIPIASVMVRWRASSACKPRKVASLTALRPAGVNAGSGENHPEARSWCESRNLAHECREFRLTLSRTPRPSRRRTPAQDAVKVSGRPGAGPNPCSVSTVRNQARTRLAASLYVSIVESGFRGEKNYGVQEYHESASGF